MKTMNEGADTARDEARPREQHLARYARSYRMTTDRPEQFFWLWQEAMAHALLLEQQPERRFQEHGGLTALQLAEGARATARFFAFMLAEAPDGDIPDGVDATCQVLDGGDHLVCDVTGTTDGGGDGTWYGTAQPGDDTEPYYVFGLLPQS